MQQQISKGAYYQLQEPAVMRQHTKELKRETRDRLTISGVFRNVQEVLEIASQNWDGGKKKKSHFCYCGNEAMKAACYSSCFAVGMLAQSAPEEHQQ